jgi:hypothetical protein
MDPAARAREPGIYVPAKKAEKPQYYQNDDDSPQHEISPSEWSNESHLVGRPGSIFPYRQVWQFDLTSRPNGLTR